MRTKIPRTKWQRGVESGKTAARVGAQVLKYLAMKPFVAEDSRRQARARLSDASGDILFQSMGLLKGTALKIAQQLSFEIDILPKEIQKELEKAYHQVPPLNRALIRKVVKSALGHPPEKVFRSFDDQAFAAASLGQVHRAVARDGTLLAVKIQYPGIDATISGDIQMLRTILRAHPDYDLVKPALAEIEERLREEIDYEREAAHLCFFKQALTSERIHIPSVYETLTCRNVLTETFVQGLPIDQWLRTAPGQAARDSLAQTLHDIFFKGLYELHCIHADPNPGNFIIGGDLTVGLVDFGCVKRLSRDFVENYRRLPQSVFNKDREAYFHLLTELKMIDPQLDRRIKEDFYQAMYHFSQWFGQLFSAEYFDFGRNSSFFSEGRALWDDIHKLRKHVAMNPDFVFLDRTRYGLMRVFEKMGARVKMRNDYEWGPEPVEK